jgi:hypothetical protein
MFCVERQGLFEFDVLLLLIQGILHGIWSVLEWDPRGLAVNEMGGKEEVPLECGLLERKRG